MTKECDQIFEVSSMGKLYRKSLAMFAHHLEDKSGNTIEMEDLAVNQAFFVVFASGTCYEKDFDMPDCLL